MNCTGVARRKLYPGGQHPVQAKRLHQHRQHQWHGQHQGGANRQAFLAQAAEYLLLLVFVGLRQAGAVAGLFHRADQQVVIQSL